MKAYSIREHVFPKKVKKHGINGVLCAIAGLICIILSVSGCGNGNRMEKAEPVCSLENVESVGNGRFVCSYNGETRSFLECPTEGEPRGIIIMLHGSASDGKAFRVYTGMDEPANARGFCVVYVDGVANPEDRSSPSGWNSGIGDSPVDDIGFLRSLAAYLQGRYSLTREETFAAGFSNGGFMMYRIALEGQDFFSGVASVAGMMPAAMWEKKPERLSMSLLQINGTKDDAVPMNCNGTAKYTKAPAIEDVIDFFVSAEVLNEEESVSLSERAVLTKHSSLSNPVLVWQVLIKDGRHSWPEEKYVGFDTYSLILDFFDTLLSNNRN